MHTRLALMSREVGVLSDSTVLTDVVALVIGDEAFGVLARLTKSGTGFAEFLWSQLLQDVAPSAPLYWPPKQSVQTSAPL